MDQEAIGLLQEAVRIRQRKEPIERAIGRAVRGKGRDYAYYISLMSELREAASMDGISIDDEVLRLVDDG